MEAMRKGGKDFWNSDRIITLNTRCFTNGLIMASVDHENLINGHQDSELC